MYMQGIVYKKNEFVEEVCHKSLNCTITFVAFQRVFFFKYRNASIKIYKTTFYFDVPYIPLLFARFFGTALHDPM